MPNTTQNTPAAINPTPSWADTEFPQPDGTSLFTNDPVARRAEGLYQLDSELFWSTDAPAVSAHLVLIPHLDELELDSRGIDRLITDLQSIRDELRAADREAGL